MVIANEAMHAAQADQAEVAYHTKYITAARIVTFRLVETLHAACPAYQYADPFNFVVRILRSSWIISDLQAWEHLASETSMTFMMHVRFHTILAQWQYSFYVAMRPLSGKSSSGSMHSKTVDHIP